MPLENMYQEGEKDDYKLIRKVNEDGIVYMTDSLKNPFYQLIDLH